MVGFPHMQMRFVAIRRCGRIIAYADGNQTGSRTKGVAMSTHDHTHDHDHPHDDHDHAHDHEHGHDHDHEHGHSHGPHSHDHAELGILGTIAAALHLPGFGHDHSHDYTDMAHDSAVRDNALGIRTVWLALLALSITTVLQIAIYVASGSVALLADTVHNLGDALNSIPLLLAFYIALRPATRRYTYGFGRAEDIAGVLIVVSIAFSAGYILYESAIRLIDPQPLENTGWVAAAALIGFIGNELVAMMQIRVGDQIGSDAMIADGQHARVDGLTSLAVLIAVFGTWIDVPILDPIVGVVIAVAIVGITWNAVKSTWFRLMDAVNPAIIAELAHAAAHVDGLTRVEHLRARWVGHRLYAETSIHIANSASREESSRIVADLRRSMHAHEPRLASVTIEIATDTENRDSA
jgi:cation diffusion facilitator family transporter